MENIFYKPVEAYASTFNPVKSYLIQLAHYIKVKTGCTTAVSQERAKALFKKRFKDRPVRYFNRMENGDREVVDGGLYAYIDSNLKAGNVVAPSFTTYMPKSQKTSLLSEFTSVNVAKRSIAKKQGQKARAEGNTVLADAKHNEQNNKKTLNNSLSGLFGLESCILHNPTAHSTLTSITRTITSISNASNERLIAGNRYLPRAIDVYRSVVFESSKCDEAETKRVVEKFGLHLPTVNDVVDVLKWSSDLYFRDDKYYREHIVPFLERLSPYQLATICYTTDLYHQRRFNNEFIKTFLSKLTTRVEPDGTNLDDVNVIYTIPEAILYFVHSTFASSMTGKGKNYSKINNDGLAKAIYMTGKRVQEVLIEYGDFLKLFFLTEIGPTNSFRLKNMRRRAVMLSDTDSSAFTLDEWVRWRCNGEFTITDETVGLAGAITFIAAENIVNQLCILSNNMNVDPSQLRLLAMKNEYTWSSFAPAEVSKHYYANTMIEEGNVFKEPSAEIKGVHLKNSAVPVVITARGTAIMKEILNKVHRNEKMRLTDIVSEMIGIERMIIDSVNKGETQFLKRSKIKEATAYAQEAEKSPYQRHLFWEQVFEPKYGSIEKPTYGVVKFPTTIKSKTALKEWVDSIEDVAFRSRLHDWLIRFNKQSLGTVMLSEEYIAGNGVPVEIAMIVNSRKIVFDITLQLRVVLGTLGVLLHDDLLISEQFHIVDNLLQPKV